MATFPVRPFTSGFVSRRRGVAKGKGGVEAHEGLKRGWETAREEVGMNPMAMICRCRYGPLHPQVHSAEHPPKTKKAGCASSIAELVQSAPSFQAASLQGKQIPGRTIILRSPEEKDGAMVYEAVVESLDDPQALACLTALGRPRAHSGHLR